MSKKDTKHVADDRYNGVNMDIADRDHLTKKEVEAEVRELNNNPRSNDIDE